MNIASLSTMFMYLLQRALILYAFGGTSAVDLQDTSSVE